MLIISASKANKIADLLNKGFSHKIRFNLISSILDSVARGDKFANEYLPIGISCSEIEDLTKEFKEIGYEVKVIQVGCELIFSVRW